MKTFTQYCEARLNFSGNMDRLGTKPVDMTTRDPNLQVNARQELLNFFRDTNKVVEFMTNPEVRKVLIPLIEKEPHLRKVIDDLSGGQFGSSSLTTRQPLRSSFPDRF